MMATVYKGYATETAARKYLAKHFSNRTDVVVEFAGGVWLVVSA